MYRKSDIYGADIPALKGKSTQSTPPAVKPEYLRTHEAQVPQVLHVDIMFIARMPFLVCVAEPLGLTIIGDLGDTKSAAQVKPQLWSAIASLKARGFVVNQVRSDRDGAISKLAVKLGKEGIHYDPSGTAQHVPIVERKIRVIKERARAVLASLHFPLPRDLLPYLVKYCVIYINMNQSNTRVDKVSPYEAFTGRKYDWKQYGKVGFGDYVQAVVPVTSNDMTHRTEGAIALFPNCNLQGSMTFLNLRTYKTIVRNKYIPLPTPLAVVDFFTRRAQRQGKSLSIDPSTDPNQHTDTANTSTDDVNRKEMSGSNLPPTRATTSLCKYH